MSGVVGTSNYGGQSNKDYGAGKYGSMDSKSKNSSVGYSANSTSY